MTHHLNSTPECVGSYRGDVELPSSSSRTASSTRLSSNAEIPIGSVFPGSRAVLFLRAVALHIAGTEQLLAHPNGEVVVAV